MKKLLLTLSILITAYQAYAAAPYFYKDDGTKGYYYLYGDMYEYTNKTGGTTQYMLIGGSITSRGNIDLQTHGIVIGTDGNITLKENNLVDQVDVSSHIHTGEAGQGRRISHHQVTSTGTMTHDKLEEWKLDRRGRDFPDWTNTMTGTLGFNLSVSSFISAYDELGSSWAIHLSTCVDNNYAVVELKRIMTINMGEDTLTEPLYKTSVIKSTGYPTSEGWTDEYQYYYGVVCGDAFYASVEYSAGALNFHKREARGASNSKMFSSTEYFGPLMKWTLETKVAVMGDTAWWSWGQYYGTIDWIYYFYPSGDNIRRTGYCGQPKITLRDSGGDRYTSPVINFGQYYDIKYISNGGDKELWIDDVLVYSATLTTTTISELGFGMNCGTHYIGGPEMKIQGVELFGNYYSSMTRNYVTDSGKENAEWAQFIPNTTIQPQTDIKYRFKTSKDSETWTDWSGLYDNAEKIDISALTSGRYITTEINIYISYNENKATFTSGQFDINIKSKHIAGGVQTTGGIVIDTSGNITLQENKFVDGVDVSSHIHTGADQGRRIDHSALTSTGTHTHNFIEENYGIKYATQTFTGDNTFKQVLAASVTVTTDPWIIYHSTTDYSTNAGMLDGEHKSYYAVYDPVQLSTSGLRTDLNAEISGRTAGDVALGIATGTLRTDLTAVSVSTGVIQSQVNSIAISTSSINADLQASKTLIGISTASLRTDLTTVGVSTGTLRTDLIAVGVATGTLRTDITALGVSTGTLKTELNAIALSTGVIVGLVNSVGQSTGTIKTSLDAEISSRTILTANLASTQTFTGVNTFTSSVTINNTLIAAKYSGIGDVDSTNKITFNITDNSDPCDFALNTAISSHSSIIRFRNSGSTKFALGIDAADGYKLKLSTGSVEGGEIINVSRLTGFIGIDKATPTYSLDIAGQIGCSSITVLNGIVCDGNTFMVDYVNNRVGIGTLTPINTLESITAGDITTGITQGESAIIAKSADGNSQELRIWADNTAKLSGLQSVESGVENKALILNGFGGNVGIGGTTATSPLYVTGNAYFTADVSALTFTDRTSYTNDKNIVWDSIKSMAAKENGDIDCANLYPYIRTAIEKTNYDVDKATNVITIEYGRNLTESVSVHNEAIKDLLNEINILKNRIEILEGTK